MPYWQPKLLLCDASCKASGALWYDGKLLLGDRRSGHALWLVTPGVVQYGRLTCTGDGIIDEVPEVDRGPKGRGGRPRHGLHMLGLVSPLSHQEHSKGS